MKKMFASVLLLTGTSASAMNYNAFAEALYWHTTETGDWAFILDMGNNFQKVTIKSLCFDWEPGMRVGLGFSDECDCWDSQVSYTGFKAHASNKAIGDNVQSEFFGPKLSDLGFFQEAKIRTEIDYNIFDWELGWTLCPTTCLSFRPMVGLKGGWIDQTLESTWLKTVDLIIPLPVIATEDLTNDFWGIGPQGGFNGWWTICDCFNLQADFSAAFMWGHWSITDFFEDTLISRIETRVRDRNFGAVMIRAFLGLGYKAPCASMKLGYEIQDWFDQYQVFDNGTGGHTNDLIFQGLRFQVRIDF